MRDNPKRRAGPRIVDPPHRLDRVFYDAFEWAPVVAAMVIMFLVGYLAGSAR